MLYEINKFQNIIIKFNFICLCIGVNWFQKVISKHLINN
jgi:hypothetical protein